MSSAASTALSYASVVHPKWQADSYAHAQTNSEPLSPRGCRNIPRATICLPLVWRIKRQDVEEAGGCCDWMRHQWGLFSLRPNKCVTPIITWLILSFCYCSSTSISFCERLLLIIPLWQRGRVPTRSMTKNVKPVISTCILPQWYHTKWKSVCKHICFL